MSLNCAFRLFEDGTVYKPDSPGRGSKKIMKKKTNHLILYLKPAFTVVTKKVQPRSGRRPNK